MSKNLIVILSDEHQARALGCAGHAFVQTPHLDKLAASGMRFTNAYTPSPICVPARAAFASGRYVHQTGHWDNAMPYTGTPMGWGHQLQGADIAVESIGKLHYRDEADEAGFDVEHIPMMVKDGVGMVWASIRQEDRRLISNSRMLGDFIGQGKSSYTDYDSAVAERTLQWLDQAKDRAGHWCLYVGLVAPHFPLVCPDPFYSLYENTAFPEAKLHPATGVARHPWIEKQNALMDTEASFTDEDERRRAFIAYYGLVSWLDNNIGKIVAKLDETGLRGRTDIIYSSDHGDNVGARGLWGKSNLYEESVAIPLIMSGPDIPAGVCDTPVSLLDVSATIPETFGLSALNEAEGKSLHNIYEEPENKDRVVFSEYHAVGAVSGGFMVRKGRFKLIHYVGFAPELFDLNTDPEEMTNLAEHQDFSSVRDELYAELKAICDPEAVDRRAHADQQALVDDYGGFEIAKTLGARAATPPPELSS